MSRMDRKRPGALLRKDPRQILRETLGRALVFVCLIAQTGTICGAQPEEFRFFKGVAPSPVPQEDIFVLPLDSDVYEVVRGKFPDIRLFDQHGQETPFLLERAVKTISERVPQWFPGEVKSFRTIDSNRAEILVAIPPDSPPADGLKLETPLRDFERRLDVWGSMEGKDWQPLVSDVLIYDYSRFVDLRHLEISLPSNQFRFLKLLIDEITETKESPLVEMTQTTGREKHEESVRTTLQRVPFRIDRIQLWHWRPQPGRQIPVTTSYPVREFQIQEDAPSKTTLVEIATRREPLTSFLLETSSTNFHRKVTVEAFQPTDSEEHVPGSKEEWTPIGSATVSVLQFRNFRQEQLEISFPETRSLRYRLRIQNQDNPPLKITGVKATGPVYQLVFLAQKDQTYRVYYGSSKVPSPQYEASEVLKRVLPDTYKPVQARLEGKPVEQKVAESWEVGEWVNRPGVLLGAIVLMVIGLGWGLWHALRHAEAMPVEQSPEEPPPPPSGPNSS